MGKTLFTKCSDLKNFVKMVNERFIRDNCDCYENPKLFNECRRTYIKFMLGAYEPKRAGRVYHRPNKYNSIHHKV